MGPFSRMVKEHAYQQRRIQTTCYFLITLLVGTNCILFSVIVSIGNLHANFQIRDNVDVLSHCTSNRMRHKHENFLLSEGIINILLQHGQNVPVQLKMDSRIATSFRSNFNREHLEQTKLAKDGLTDSYLIQVKFKPGTSGTN